MTAPPARNTLSGTPTNAQFNAGIGALYDYTVGLLGASGTPDAARAALGAVGTTGDQTIAGVKTFSSPIAGATNSQVSLTGDQTIDGVKTFSQPPRWGEGGSRGILLPGGTDLNTITDAGWYDVNTLVNAPAGTADWIHLTVSRGHTPLWVLQTAADFHSDRIWFRRSMNAGGAAGWQPWVPLVLSAASETVSGRVELADATEAAAGTDGTRALSPLRLRDALAATGSAPIYACRAWVNFNGTGTVAIRASGNVSSITDNGVGDYTVNFTTAMPDVNYAAASMLGPVGSSVSWMSEYGTRTASAISVVTVASSTATDYSIVQLTIHR